MILIVKVSQFIYATLQVKTIGEIGSRGRRRKRERRRKGVRDSVQLERVVASNVNLTVGQIPRSSMMDNPQENNIT
jgi:hypothetical protein